MFLANFYSSMNYMLDRLKDRSYKDKECEGTHLFTPNLASIVLSTILGLIIQTWFSLYRRSNFRKGPHYFSKWYWFCHFCGKSAGYYGPYINILYSNFVEWNQTILGIWCTNGRFIYSCSSNYKWKLILCSNNQRSNLWFEIH